METLAWLGDFHPKKLVREGANWHEGTRGWVNKGAVTKKNWIWAETFSLMVFLPLT